MPGDDSILLCMEPSSIRSRFSLGLRESSHPVITLNPDDRLESVFARSRPRLVLLGGTEPLETYLEKIDRLSMRYGDTRFVLVSPELERMTPEIEAKGVAGVISLHLNVRDLIARLPSLFQLSLPVRERSPQPPHQPASKDPSSGPANLSPPTFRILGSSQIALRLKESITLAANFPNLLLLRGEEGVEFESIVRSLAFPESGHLNFPLILSKAEVSANRLEELNASLNQSPHQTKPLVYLSEIEELAPHERETLLQFITRHLGSRSLGFRLVLSSVTNSFYADLQSESFLQQLMPSIDEVVDIPALRERPEDIPEIAQEVLYQLTFIHSILTVREIEPAALEYLGHLEWRGNLDELVSTLRSACASCNQRTLSLSHLNSLRLDDSGSAQMHETSADQIFFEG
ncbi:MAG: hypothetical protein ACFCU4_02450 [Puniceicoccaceae bacterium]